MNLKSIHNVYFIGIGGIGMSALARYFHNIGKNVRGYDKTVTELTHNLEASGIGIHYEDLGEAIPERYKNKDNTLVVYTPAIPNNHLELQYFQTNNFTVLKRAAVLGLITNNSYCFAVAGTHGKTTTSSILGHLLKVCNENMTAFLGGITENYHSNLIMNGDKISVVEADEYDRSFLQLAPDVACITSMDADHLDIYGEANALEKSFIEFSEKVENKNKLFIKNGLPIEGITYGINDESDYTIKDIKIENGSYHFNIKTPKELVENIVFDLPGDHNISNALVAFAMAYDYGCNINDLRDGLATFKGVERRFTYQIKAEKFVLIDDYAHHPTEINAVHQAISFMYPSRKIIAIFQPHLFSRTRDFVEEFAVSLSKFDAIRLLDIYPARELPIEGVSSNWLLSKIKNIDKKIISKAEMSKEIIASNYDIALIIGAGDIGAEVVNVKKELLVELELE